MKRTGLPKTFTAIFLLSVFCFFWFFWVFFVDFAALAEASDTAPLHARAKNLYDVCDYRTALSLYEQILALDPEDGIAWDLSAWCLRYLGEKARAVETYKKALTLLTSEDAVWPLVGLGEVYLDERHYEEAIPFFQKAAASNNEEASERALRGLEMAQNGAAKQERPPEIIDASDRQFEILTDEAESPTAEDVPAKPEPQESPVEEDVPAKPEPQKSAPKKADPAKAADKKGKRPENPRAPETNFSLAEETPPPVQREEVYGIALGSPLEEALAALRERGHEVGEPFSKDAKIYYAIQGLPVVLSDALTRGTLYERGYVVGYKDAVLSVLVERDYDSSHSFEDMKAAITGELRDTKGVKFSNSVFSYEMHVALSHTHGLRTSVMDKLNKTCRLEIEHIHLASLSYYLMAGGR